MGRWSGKQGGGRKVTGSRMRGMHPGVGSYFPPWYSIEGEKLVLTKAFGPEGSWTGA